MLRGDIGWNGTLGRAKEDLDRAAKALTARLANLSGEARVVTLKAIVSQASSAIPVVPLYTSLLFRVMKDAGVHEEIIEHIHRLFATQLADGAQMNLDGRGASGLMIGSWGTTCRKKSDVVGVW